MHASSFAKFRRFSKRILMGELMMVALAMLHGPGMRI